MEAAPPFPASQKPISNHSPHEGELRPAPTHCQGLAKSLLYRPALWHSLCTLNSHCNSLRWVGEVRRLAVGSKCGFPKTLTFLDIKDDVSGLQREVSFLFFIFICLYQTAVSAQEEIGCDTVLTCRRTVVVFLKACVSVMAFFFSVKDLLHWVFSRKAELTWSCIHFAACET